MSVSLLVGVSSSWWDVFLKFFETFLGCLYTSRKYIWISFMSVSLLVGLLSYWYNKNIGISWVLDDISFSFFGRHSWDVGTLVPNNSEFLICVSVCKSSYFPADTGQILGNLLFWMICLSEILLRHSWDVCLLFPNASKCIVCLSLC